MEDKGWPFIRVSWEPPHKADTRSGWITLIYEIRVKLEEENDWEVRWHDMLTWSQSWRKWMHIMLFHTDWLNMCCVSRCTSPASRRCLTSSACGRGASTSFRCAVSPITVTGASGVPLPTSKSPTVRNPLMIMHSPLHSTHIPFYIRHVVTVTLCLTDFHREKSVWILITVFCAFIFLILTWLLHMNSRRWNSAHELLTSCFWLPCIHVKWYILQSGGSFHAHRWQDCDKWSDRLRSQSLTCFSVFFFHVWSLKHFLLPPVPGPKIKGFDKQLLKVKRQLSGQSSDSFIISPDHLKKEKRPDVSALEKEKKKS